MKKLFSMLLALAAFVAASAQTTTVATLTHNGTTTPYVGVDGFKSAYAAAQNGDVISLSAGTFNACDIAKAITIYGEGYVDDPETNRKKTVLINNFSISPSTSAQATSADFVLEGIFTDDQITWKGANNAAWIKKCRIKNLNTQANTTGELNILNCRISTNFYFQYNTNENINFYNSICVSTYLSASYVNFLNCLLIRNYTATSDTDLHNCVILNSIIYSVGGYPTIPRDNNVDYCFGINLGSGLFQYFLDNNNNRVDISDYAIAFPDAYKGYSDTEPYILKEDFPYLGNDGTELGIYGGFHPFNADPSYPRITKMEVETQSTEDGKLNVNIQVTNPK